jgi:carboxypeptidase T
LLLLSAVAFAQDPIGAWIEVPGPSVADEIRRMGLDFVEKQDGEWYLFHGDSASMSALHSSKLRWRPAALSMTSSAEGYHDAAEMRDAILRLSDAYPEHAQVVSLGESRLGRPILALAIGNMNAPAIEWRILGAHHGDELSSAESALDAAETLLRGTDRGGGTSEIIERDLVWVVPHVNPDGVEEQSRYNAASVDLNRNYDYEWSDTSWASGPEAFSEPETRAIRTLADWTGVGTGISIHSGATNLGWVWNHTTTDTGSEDHLRDMAADYASVCTQPDFWITNGADWYITHGDTNDWSYGRHGILDFTLEVSLEKTPPHTEVAAILDHHRDAIVDFLSPPAFFFGQLLDAQTGLGIPGTITFAEGDVPLHTGPDGRFGRPTGQIEGEAWAEAPGYAAQLVDFSGADKAISVLLEPVHLAAHRPTPVLLSRGGDGRFTLDSSPSRVSLSRPGHETVAASAADGTWRIDLDSLAPGPWNLLVDDEVSPRSIFIGEYDSDVLITQARWDNTQLDIEGVGFALGSRAWALWGAAREPVSLPLVDEDDTLLGFDASALPEGEDIDIIVISHGYQLAILALATGAHVDTGAPLSWDTDGTDSGFAGPDLSDSGELMSPAITSCSCTSSSSDFPHRGLVVSLGLLFLGRRRNQ